MLKLFGMPLKIISVSNQKKNGEIAKINEIEF